MVLIFLNYCRSLPRQPGPGLSPEAFVYNLLYEVNLPSPGQSIKLYLPPTESHLSPITNVSIDYNYIRTNCEY